MDNELARYIVTHFNHLLTDEERLGLKHLRSKYKIEYSHNQENIEQRVLAYKNVGWLTEDEDILELVKGGEEELDIKIADRILTGHPDKVFINNCPNCGRLARTPFARQCRYCRNSWR